MAKIKTGSARMKAARSRASASVPMHEPETRKDRVIHARYVSPAQMLLKFADGFAGTWGFDQLQLNMAHMKPTTIRASASGTSVEVDSRRGAAVELDASSLRVLVDPAYAAHVDKILDGLAKKIGI